MPVDGVTVGTLCAEGIQNAVGHLFLLAQLEVVALGLAVSFLVVDEVALEGGHLRLVEEWALRSAPEVEEIVLGITCHLGCAVVLEGGADHHAGLVEQFLAFVAAAGIDLHFLQLSIGRQRH